MDKRLSLFSRVVFAFVAINALLGAGALMFFPGNTDLLFFWTITPPINAALFGALYFAGALVVGYLTWRGFWEPMRFLVPVLVSAGILISLTTLLHLERFTPGIKLGYWLLVYIGAPLLALYIYWREDRGGANWQVTAPLTRVTLAISGVLGVALVLLGLAMLVLPAPFVAN